MSNKELDGLSDSNIAEKIRGYLNYLTDNSHDIIDGDFVTSYRPDLLKVRNIILGLLDSGEIDLAKSQYELLKSRFDAIEQNKENLHNSVQSFRSALRVILAS